MNKTTLLVTTLAIAGVAGGLVLTKLSPQSAPIVPDTAPVAQGVSPGDSRDNVIMDPEEAAKYHAEQAEISHYSPFVKKDYEEALAKGQLIVLDFYADWCPICRAEAPELEQAFFELNDPKVMGFRVNFKDVETDNDEKELAKQFAIPYQHTKIILKNGKEVARHLDQWDKETAVSAIRKELR